MSVLYGFDLVVPRRALRAAVEALARRADPEGFSGCTVEIPGESAISVPFDGQGEDGPLDIVHVNRPTWLDGSLWFPLDDCVRGYLGRDGRGAKRRTVSRGEEASIGLVGIFLYAGERFAIIAVGAATSSMSFLFEESRAIRSMMIAVSREAGGVATLLSRQPGEPYELLAQPGSVIRFAEYDGDDPRSIDRFVEDVLRRTSSGA